jgi:hypothetical protein
MSLVATSLFLRAWHREGMRLRPAEFVNRVVIAPGDPVIKHKGAGHARIELISLVDVEFDEAPEPANAMLAALQDGLVKAAQWLAKQSPALFHELRSAGFVTDILVFVVGKVEEATTLDLDLPPEFLAECGRLGLTVSITISTP